MKNKILKITSLFMSMIMLVTVNSGLTATAYAASKPAATKITSISGGGVYKIGSRTAVDTTIKFKKISYKDSDSAMDYYVVQYSEDKNFKSGVNVISGPCSDGNLVFNDMMFSPNETIYFRVRVMRQNYKQKLKKVSWSSTKQKVWALDSTTYSDWSSKYKYYTDWQSNSALDEGLYDGIVQAKAVIAQVGITDSMSDLEKVARVQNWINKNWYYYDDNDEGNIFKISNTYDVMFYTKYGVCEDFANHFLVFMYILEIPCTIIYSASLNHAWNLVKIDGYWWGYNAFSNGGAISSGCISNDTLTNESKKIWDKCQSHGQDISKTSLADKNSELNNIINSL